MFIKAQFKTALGVIWAIFLISSSYAQNKEISGTVTDENGVPIPAVNINVKDTDNGTQTDFDGNYLLLVEEGQELRFSALGFEVFTTEVGEDSVIDVVLEEQSEALDQVVITAFGRKATRNELTANVTTIKSDDLEKTTFASVQEGLQGKAPGLSVFNTSGIPGSSPEIRIRGMNSITAGNNPLYVLDGVPINTSEIGGQDNGSTTMDLMSLIDPHDIEEVSVLKDASAVAPYGAEGSGGVILITTKAGHKGKPRYHLGYGLSVNNPARRGLQMMNAEQRYDALHEAYWNGYGDGGAMPSDEELDNLILSLGNETVEHWKEIGRPSTNWFETVRQKNALSHDLNFSASGGQDKSSFFASLGYTKQEGTVIGTDFERISGSLKFKQELNDKINFEVSGRVANGTQLGLPEGDKVLGEFDNVNYTKWLLPPFVPAYDKDGSINIDDFNPYADPFFNPVYTQTHNELKHNILRGIQNTTVNWDILEGLRFTTRMGLDFTLHHFDNYQNPIHGAGKDPHGSKTEDTGRMFNLTTQSMLDYDFTLGDKNNFDATVVFEYNKLKDKENSSYGENFPNADLKDLSATSANWKTSSTYRERMNMRWVGLLNYDYDGRYLLNASYTYQGDSRFSDRWGSFYSVGLGWNLYRENFMENADFVDQLRLKLGYGRTGNADIGINEYQSLFGFGTYRNTPAGIIEKYGSDVTWEKSDRFDVSLDYGFFDHRLWGTIGYFHNLTRDMLLQTPLPISQGFPVGEVLRNNGEMRNNGIEFQIEGNLIHTPSFNWDLGFNISTIHNEVTAIPGDAEKITDRNVVQKGHQAYEWFLPEWAGVNPDNGDPLWYVDRTKGEETTNEINNAERQYIGKGPLPTYSGSFTTNFTFKNFFLSGQLYFSGGNAILEDRVRYTQATGSNITLFNTSEAAYLHAWRAPGDEATYPRFDALDTNIDDSADHLRNSTRFLHNGDFMRLRNVEVGYTFRDQLKNSPFQAITLSIQGTNLWTWVRDKTLEQDPEVRTDGVTNMTAPPIKSVTFNVNVNF